jgi:2-polyprenyl-3-methyl-5-hydroxy-6-metoxy-1,4-benzoquinol methylase
MDQSDLDARAHQHALASLATINRLSWTARILLRPILALARSRGQSRFTLLDVACGGGDVPLQLAHLCASRGVQLDLILSDRSETALSHGHAHLAAQAATTCAYLRCDAFSDDLPQADIVTNSLFLHHLDSEQVTSALSHFASRARQLLLISDLRRSRMGLAVAWSTCHVFSRSPVVHHDGPASVRAAYTIDEMREFATGAGLEDVDIHRCWPWRMLLCWRRKA